MAPTLIERAERDRDSIKGTIEFLEKVVVDHAAVPLTEIRVDHFGRLAETQQTKLLEVQDRIVHIAPADIDVYKAEYHDLLLRISEVQCKLQEIKAVYIAAQVPVIPIPTVPSEIRLPRMELPTFDGSLANWMSFRDLFIAAVHDNTKLSKAQKLTYLKTSLKGEAARQVSSLTLSDANYDIAWSQLRERYQNDRELLFTILRRFINQPNLTFGSSTSLRTLIDISRETIRSLEVIKVPVNHWDSILLFLIFQKLDPSSKELWEHTLKDSSIPPLKDFLEFLEQRSRALAAGGSVKPHSTRPQQQGGKPDVDQNQRKVNVHHVQTPSECKVCASGNHPVYKCLVFMGMEEKERHATVKKLNLCFNCLRDGHSLSQCSCQSVCRTCKGKHHSLLHRYKQGDPNPPILSHHSSDSTQITQTMLATALVKVQDCQGQLQLCRALVDGGSTASFLTTSCLQRLGLTHRRTTAEVVGLSATAVGTAKGMVDLVIRPHFNGSDSFTVTTLVLPKVTGQLPIYPCDPTVWPHLSNLTLADPQFHKPAPIDLLLGADIFWNLILDGKRTGPPNSPVALRSSLGWLIAGNLNAVSSEVFVHFSDIDLDETLRKFWELESTPTARSLSPEEQACEDHFIAHTTRDDTGRFTVHLPLKEPRPVLGSSRNTAIRRLKSLEKRLSQKQDVRKDYTNFMNEYLALGHMMQIPSEDVDKPVNLTCYIPHHFVIKDSSSTTKLRVVFDASAKTSSGISLNQTLMVGPTIQDSLMDILMRFRTHAIAFTADVAKMYRQIRVIPADADLQRIVWRSDPSHPIQDFRLLTVTYGTASAPYLATRVLQQLARDHELTLPLASSITLRDFYVDDLMSGAATVEEALEKQAQLLELTNRGGLSLRKWSSNSDELLQSLQPDLRETQTLLAIDADPVKTLGVYWNPTADEFLFKVTLPLSTSHNTESPDPIHANIQPYPTKRILLSEVAKIFDPLGWLAPIIIRAKILIQQLWKLSLGWDDPLPADVVDDWETFKKNLPAIETLRILRCTVPSTYSSIKLVGFSDASEKAYAAVVYLCVYGQHDPLISLVSSKTRVAPAKQVSLPRLELCGALLLSQLIISVDRALQLKIDQINCWTDSTVVLAWICGHSSRWKTFVANRVTEIQNLVPASQWGHVRGVDNPADCASRGIDPTDLPSHPLWWTGPEWLRNDDHPTNNDEGNPEDVLIEERIIAQCHATTTPSDFSPFDRFSSLRKLKRFAALVLRFGHNVQTHIQIKKNIHPINHIQTGPLTAKELDDSLTAIVKFVQQQAFPSEISHLQNGIPLSPKSRLLPLNPFVDSNSVLRVGGRLRHANLPEDQRIPMLLPKHHPFTQLLIMSLHLEYFHAGPQLLLTILHRRFWVIGARDAVRHLVRKCVVCTRHAATIQQQFMGDLPAARVNPTRPFQKWGVDFAGPFLIRSLSPRSKVTLKAYLSIFVCFTTRAVHLEVVSSLSTDAFIAAMRRFISRRGRPSDIFSDCGTNFVGANRELNELITLMKSTAHNEVIAKELADQSIQWHFNPPGAPHFGGLWEAGVKSVKFHLTRVLKSTRLTFEELTTMMTQIEACLNSRPLTPISPDPSDLAALTPGHFLIGAPLTALPQRDLLSEKAGRLSRWQLIQQVQQQFWKRWSNEVITRLQQRPKWMNARKDLQLDDMVLIKDENLPPLKWRLGRIVELHPGADGKVRVVTIKTGTGDIKRPIVKVCLLPIDSNLNSESSDILT